MKITIDPFTSSANWTITGATNLIEETTWSHLATSLLPGQIFLKFLEPGTATLTLPAPVDVSKAEHLQFSMRSYYEGAPHTVRFIFGTGPLYEYVMERIVHFGQERFEVPATSYIVGLEIEATERDDLVLSEFLGVKDELPIDLYRGLAQLLEQQRDETTRIMVGSFSALAGASSITIEYTGPDTRQFLDKSTAIQFGDELHLIEEYNAAGLTRFNRYLDGKIIGGPYTDEPIYLHVPVNIEPGEDDVMAPSIALGQAFASSSAVEEGESKIYDSVKADGSARERPLPTLREWTGSITLTSRHGGTLQYLNEICTEALGSNSIIWVNGIQCDIFVEDFVPFGTDDPTDVFSRLVSAFRVKAARDGIDKAKRVAAASTFEISIGVELG